MSSSKLKNHADIHTDQDMGFKLAALYNNGQVIVCLLSQDIFKIDKNLNAWVDLSITKKEINTDIIKLIKSYQMKVRLDTKLSIRNNQKGLKI